MKETAVSSVQFNTILVKFVVPSKIVVLNEVTVAGMLISVNAVQPLNSLLFNVASLDGSVNDARLVQPVNADPLNDVILFSSANTHFSSAGQLIAIP